MIAVPFGIAALRFLDFLQGGVFFFRDAGFFFVPWRTVYIRSLRAGEFPAWNDWMSTGRAFAADPNAGVFFPLNLLALPLGLTPLVLANIALSLGLFLWALRRLGLSRAASAGGALVLLFAGVYQTLPILFSSLGAAAPLPIAWVALYRMDACRGKARWAAIACASLALGLSALAGEPAITATGGVAGIVLLAIGSLGRTGGRETRQRLLAGAAAFLLAIGLSAVQVFPTAAELRHSVRAERMRPEHGALYWSVRPARILTLLEPRLTGDPIAENDAEFWGAGTFDAGNPYFYDLSIGLLPLLFALSSIADRRGRAFLLLAGLGALAALGRHLPGFTSIAGLFAVFRYPEKWWLVSTLSLATAAAVGIDLFLTGRGSPGGTSESSFGIRAQLLLRRSATGLLAILSAACLLAFAAPETLRRGLWALGLGAGPTTAEQVGAILGPLLLAGAGTMAVALLLFQLEKRGHFTRPFVLGILIVLFLGDGWRRVAGTCPARPSDLYVRESPPVTAVKSVLASGRFYDDGADSPALSIRRASADGGFDRLRPETGVVFGIRYAAENDIDRMMPVESVEAIQEISNLPWGAEKLAVLRSHGVTVVRTASPEPDPPGAIEVARFGADRILRIEGTRAEFALLPEAVLDTRSRRFGSGRVVLLERRAGRQRLRVSAGPEQGYLAIARTFDPNWHATIDGEAVPLLRAEGGLSALLIPAGEDRRVELRYENAIMKWGALVSIASAFLIAFLFVAKDRAKE
jgi:hypothetical protein